MTPDAASGPLRVLSGVSLRVIRGLSCDYWGVTVEAEQTFARWHLPKPAEDGRVIGGVAAALADEIGVDPFVIRVAFLVLAAAGGWGVLLYLVLFGLMWLTGSPNPEGRYEPVSHISPKSTR